MNKYLYHLNPMTMAIVSVLISGIWCMFQNTISYDVNPIIVGIILIAFSIYMTLCYLVNDNPR
jgi:uncharacterized membrane protein HdeD (DUF308 family)